MHTCAACACMVVCSVQCAVCSVHGCAVCARCLREVSTWLAVCACMTCPA